MKGDSGLVCDICGGPLPEARFIRWSYHKMRNETPDRADGMYCSDKCHSKDNETKKLARYEAVADAEFTPIGVTSGILADEC